MIETAAPVTQAQTEKYPSRENYWEECDAEQKMERLRDAVARICRETSVLAQAIQRLAAHSHGENGLLVPIHFADSSANLAGSLGGGLYTHDNGIPFNLRIERERR
jgi:hypothetical protein